MKLYNIIRLIFIVILIIGMFLLPQITSTSRVQVSVLPSDHNHTLAMGETFDLAVIIDPMETYIAGAKLNLEYNKDMLIVNKVTEGDLFKQNGANTFFNRGVVDNSDGTVKNIFNLILGRSNISNPGTFIIVNLTVVNSTGHSWINLSNIEISDPDGFLISAYVFNGTFNSKMESTELPETRFINGTVFDFARNGISGVTVSANNSMYTSTNEFGSYSLEVVEGTYYLTASSDPIYFTNNSITASTIGSSVVIQDIELDMKPKGIITGKVLV